MPDRRLATVPKDYFTSFLVLAQLKILPRTFAQRIALSTSLRNILVHEYATLDEKKFKKALGESLKDYTKYVAYIQSYLKRK